MRIHGIGTDIINIKRIKKSISKTNFLEKLFNKIEIKRCESQMNKVNCYAKRFAAKEAFSKALGTGISKGIKFDEIVINNVKSGKPHIKLIGNTKKKVNKILKNKKFIIYLSLSDDKLFAVATVVISL
tara:strand:+ start:3109 stop:3492 length:384 start_codon:yes stop_codon:yes gene_type:complete